MKHQTLTEVAALLAAGLVLWFTVGNLLSARGGEIKQRYECVLPMGPTISDIKPGYFKAVATSDTEIAQQIALREAEMKLKYEAELNDAKIDKQKDRDAAENKVRLVALLCMSLGFALLIAGICCCIWADKATGAKGIVAGVIIGGTFGAIVALTQWFVLIFGIGALLGSIALGVWLWRSGRANVVLEKAVEGGEVLKNTDGWAADQPAHDRVRVIQGAKPGQKTLSWIEQRIAETRDAIRARKAKAITP